MDAATVDTSTSAEVQDRRKAQTLSAAAALLPSPQISISLTHSLTLDARALHPSPASDVTAAREPRVKDRHEREREITHSLTSLLTHAVTVRVRECEQERERESEGCR